MAGFETFNDAGALQFSSDLMHYHLVRKGSAPMNDNSLYTGFGDFTYPGGADQYSPPLVFDGSGNGPPLNLEEYQYAAFSCSQPINGLATRSTSSPILTWYVFEPFSRYTPTSNIGMQIFNANGDLTYDANAKPMIVVRRQLVGALYSGMDVALGLPAGRTYAAYVSSQSLRQTGPLPNWNDAQSYAVPFNGAGIAFRMVGGDVRISEYPRTDYTSASTAAGVLTVLDVTGF